MSNTKHQRFGFWLSAAFFYALLAIHFGARINPVLIFRNQEPVFFTTLRFFESFPAYPGGLAEYTAAFLGQFFAYPWTGTIILLLLVGGTQALTAFLFGNASDEKKLRFASFIPAGLLAVMLGHYDFPLVTAIGLLVTLNFSCHLLRIRNRHIGILVPVYIGMIACAYYLIAGPYLLFVGISLVTVLLMKKKSVLQKTILLGIILLVAWLGPRLFNPAIGVMPLSTSYLKWIPLSASFGWPFVPVLCFGFVIVWTTLLIIFTQWKSSRTIPFQNRWNTWYAVILRILVPMGLAILILLTVGDETTRSGLSIRLHARNRNWEGVLSEIRRHPDIDKISSFHMHRALYHTGQLGDAMFRYPQELGIDGLILLKEDALFHAIEVSNFWFDMAHYNEAEHWAHEAITQQGATPWILRRLAEINAVKANRPMLQSMTVMLDNTLFHRKWAETFQAKLDSSVPLENQVDGKRARDEWIGTDFLVHLNLPEMDLVSLIRRNPKNRMAYEYLMAYYLLARQLGWFVDEIEHMKNFPYSRLPLHWEEALLVFMAQTGRTDPVFGGFLISTESARRFMDYQRILARYGGNKQSAHGELRRKYGGTYWYYLMYTESNMRFDSGEGVDASTGATR